MEKKPKLSFQRPVEKEAEQPKEEYQQEDALSPLEESMELYVQSFIYFSNYCGKQKLPPEFVMVLWQIFMQPQPGK